MNCKRKRTTIYRVLTVWRVLDHKLIVRKNQVLQTSILLPCSAVVNSHTQYHLLIYCACALRTPANRDRLLEVSWRRSKQTIT